MGYKGWQGDTGRDWLLRVAGRYTEEWVIKYGREIQGEMGYEVWQGDTGKDGL